MKECLTFDDVQIKDRYSTIEHRSTDCDVYAQFTKKKTIRIPIVSSPMDRVTGCEMALALATLGGVGIVHRFQNIDDQVKEVKKIGSKLFSWSWIDDPILAAAVGATGDFLDRARALLASGANVLLIDIAKGNSLVCCRSVEKLRSLGTDFEIIAGNVATTDGAITLCDAGVDAVRVGIGNGCFKSGTRILMSNGIYKNIEDVEKGDEVINKFGQSVGVRNVVCTGKKQVSKIRHNKFYVDTWATADHNYWVGDLSRLSKNTIRSRGYKKSFLVNGQENVCWKKIGRSLDDVLLFPSKIQFDMSKHFSVDLNKRRGHRDNYVVDSVLVPSYELGYVFGTFLGDGCASTAISNGRAQGSCHWYFGKNEVATVDKLTACLINTFPNASDPVMNFSENMSIVHFHYKPLADFLSDFGKKENKHLPEEFFVNDVSYLNGIYDGLLDSDGCKSGRVSFHNTSHKLIELFNIIHFIKFGSLPNSSARGNATSGLENINLKNVKTLYQSRVSKREIERRVTDNYQLVKILDYDEGCDLVDVYDIEVECPSHSFIANNAIVHNSMCETRIRTGVGTPQITAIMDCVCAVNGSGVPIIADGGIRWPGDVAKAIAAGADTVMIGRLFAGTDEAPGELIKIGEWGREKRLKEYRGSASRSAKVDRGETDSYVEGNSKLERHKGPVEEIVEDIVDGLKTSMSYVGAKSLDEFRAKAEFQRVTAAGTREAYPYALYD